MTRRLTFTGIYIPHLFSLSSISSLLGSLFLSYGIVLWELVTGGVPYQEEGFSALDGMFIYC